MTFESLGERYIREEIYISKRGRRNVSESGDRDIIVRRE